MSGINNDVIMSFDVALFSIYSLIEGILHGVQVLSLDIALVFLQNFTYSLEKFQFRSLIYNTKCV